MAGRPAAPPVTDLHAYQGRYISPAQLARYVGMTRISIYRHINKGALHARKIGGALRIEITEARRYVNVPAR